MNLWRLTMTIGAALALSVAVWTFSSNSGREQQIKALEEKVDALAARLQSERELAARAESPRAAEPSALPGTKDAAVAERPLGAASEREKAERETAVAPPPANLTAQQMAAHFDEVFFTNPNRDPAWEKEAQTLAASKVRQALPQSSQLRSVECHLKMCRIETVHNDREAFKQFAQQMSRDASSRPWSGAGFATLMGDGKSSDGRITMVMYLAREGEELPIPAQASDLHAAP